MPPHSSHLLQPLDVACFAPLKQSYGKKVEGQIRAGINHVDRMDFLSLYIQAHAESFTEQTVQSAFEVSGLVPYDPQRVLSKLQISTPSPPSSSHGTQSSWTPQTPKSLAKIQRQSARLRNRIQDRTTPLSSPTNRFMDKFFQNYEKLMVQNVLLTQENIELRSANAKQLRKRKSSYVPQGGAARRRVADAEESVQTATEESIQTVAENPVRTAAGNSIQAATEESVQKKASKRCSVCRAYNHTARTCSERIYIA
jgi:DDE superfamily endonuclease